MVVSNIFCFQGFRPRLPARGNLAIPKAWVIRVPVSFAMVGSDYLWGVEGPDKQWSPVLTTNDGCRCDVVCQLACKHDGSNLAVVFPCNSTVRLEGTNLPVFDNTTFMVTIFGAIFRREPTVLVLTVDSESMFCNIEFIQRKIFHKLWSCVPALVWERGAWKR